MEFDWSITPAESGSKMKVSIGTCSFTVTEECAAILDVLLLAADELSNIHEELGNIKRKIGEQQ